ncbi:NAD(P)-binding protein [Lentithecium fluviatile CBS 122367]|uniref:NAD(P)-binding protein n=1 Tax=Lentithecium fluviatile CBS 122367 TaxID=1168545 RepID=A0A6G1J282_9PLEO|nr:NAD(P)-binding protein [Lentithecium fluviatile CBS 122367]
MVAMKVLGIAVFTAQTAARLAKSLISTGTNQGIGFELVKLLYPTGGTIYQACRSQERIEKAIQGVIASHRPAPFTPTTLKHLHLGLNDLTTIKSSAATFASQEQKLDILLNNAGIKGHIRVNCIAPLLFTQELLPQLHLRIVWTVSLMVEMYSPPGGINFLFINAPAIQDTMRDYAACKAGNVFLCGEAAQQRGKYHVVSVVQNPGNLPTCHVTSCHAVTNIYKYQPWWLMPVVRLIFYARKYGAYTMLFAGFTDEVRAERNKGVYVRPFGIVAPNGRRDVYKAIARGKRCGFGSVVASYAIVCDPDVDNLRRCCRDVLLEGRG